MNRLILALWLGKLITIFTRTFKIGGGSAAPGYYALKIDPQLVDKLAKQITTNVIVTGTNGKTTTCRLINHLLETNQATPLRNASGSNLERGVASALISSSNWLGQIDQTVAVWEVDEAAFNSLVFKIKPQLMLFLNAFRDQLDRYGEVDTVVNKWISSLEKVDWPTHIIVNNGDPNTVRLHQLKQPVEGFRVVNHQLMSEKAGQKITQVKDQFQAKVIKNQGLKGTILDLSIPNHKIRLNFHIPGVYHVYDLLAAASVLYNLNHDLTNLADKLASFTPAFGRVEQISLDNHQAYMFLIKNPAGATAVFETIAPTIEKDDLLLMALNDNFADGTDVSWIWDAQFEILAEKHANKSVICTGTRAYDLAVRLKYAGWNSNQISVIPELEPAFNQARQQIKNKLFILPTYTALLQLQTILARQGIKEHYWRQS